MLAKKAPGTVSAKVVRYLQNQGYTQKQIGGRLDVTESFISYVAHGSRNFTIDHLERLAEVMETTLPGLLALAIPVESIPRSRRKGYQLLLKSLKSSSEFRRHLGQSRRRTKTAIGA